MISAILYPSKNNILVWANACFLLLLVLFNQIDSLTVVFAYFLETIVIGLFHIVKLWIVSNYGMEPTSDKGLQLKGLPLILFFIAHYGIFVGVQSVFAFALFEGTITEITDAFYLVQNYWYVINREGMSVVMASLVVTNLGYFYTNFWANEKYKEYTPSAIFIKPYVRIFIQQFVVILAFFFFIIFSTAKVAAILLILLRLLVDLVMVSLNKDSQALDNLARKYSKSYDHYLEMKKKYQEFSE
ncbi:MAG: DUF6498-containing protein [Altibacter sp.]|uniref:DUF6498-containing protein n=1 Tax=Altibacter sp. TaxID=2024823 RepID=UPI001D73323A|nr:DUF6498-containing protein [Altibacter sp.]MBZ0328353.1 DUF6498-containing protein [Altibacter sp.]